MRLREHYDWIVIGDSPGALLSAALVSKLGLSVLVLPMPSGPTARVSVSRSGQYRDPESTALIGLQGGLLGQCLEHVGILPAEAARIALAEGFPQVVTPTTRLHLDGDRAALKAECAREFGRQDGGWLAALLACEESINRFWLELPQRLLLDPASGRKLKPRSRSGASLDRVLSAVAQTHRLPKKEARWLLPGVRISELCREGEPAPADLPEIASGLYSGISGAAESDPVGVDFLQAAVLGAGCGRFRGGITAFRELLLRISRRLGATIPEGVECRRVFVEAGRWVGVQVSQHGNMISSPGGVVGTSLAQLEGNLTYGSRSLFRTLKAPLVPEGWKFTLALTVHEEAIPPGLAARAVWKERGAPPLELEVVSPSDYQLADGGLRFIFARTTLPFSDETLSPTYLRVVAARMFRQMTEILPFLEFHVKKIFPDFRPPGADEFLEAYPFRSVSEIPGNMRVYGAHEGLGSRSGLEGLFVVSGESFPRYGTLGETVAALESVAWLAHRSGLAGPILSQDLPGSLAAAHAEGSQPSAGP